MLLNDQSDQNEREFLTPEADLRLLSPLHLLHLLQPYAPLVQTEWGPGTLLKVQLPAEPLDLLDLPLLEAVWVGYAHKGQRKERVYSLQQSLNIKPLLYPPQFIHLPGPGGSNPFEEIVKLALDVNQAPAYDWDQAEIEIAHDHITMEVPSERTVGCPGGHHDLTLWYENFTLGSYFGFIPHRPQIVNVLRHYQFAYGLDSSQYIPRQHPSFFHSFSRRTQRER